MQKVLVICGPTGVGKTALALELAKKFNGELVSADSRQVYRGLDIITAKGVENAVQRILPWKEENVKYYWEVEEVPIYLLDVVDPSQEFSVSHYVSLAYRAIDNIISRNKLPIIVGGTGLYIKALVEGIETLNIPPNKDLREKYSKKTADELFQILLYLDSNLANSLNRSEQNNKQRLIRRIEILQTQGEKLSQKENVYDFFQIGLTASELILKERIGKRIAEWIKYGAEDEANLLISKLLTSQASTAIALPAWRLYFEGKEPLSYVASYWESKDWQYAKRQMTWFKKQKDINWFDLSEKAWKDKVEKLVSNWYNSTNY